ncbi:MAG: 50S ribosomal protein L17 [Syntrophorhabdus sp. PtaU1.Bin058]|nr:MAG: 50S ribosomal protein L17 [Syntrophorhabdus sp. PtaU1.Bin058]
MRHMNRVKTLNKKKGHRRALFQNLANALFNHESIKTTSAKAMELKKVADRLITLAKRKDTHSMRLTFAVLRDKEIVRKLFTDIGERYKEINGGYTRVLKIGNRKGDNAPMAVIELTQKKEKEEKKEKTEKKKVTETKAKPKAKAKAKEEKKETPAKKEKKEKAAKEKTEKTEAKEKKPRKRAAKKETETEVEAKE